MKNYLIVLFFLIVNSAIAQTVVTGKVVDATTKQALPSFNVYVNNTSIGTNTDNDGKFRLTVPNTGKIEFIISHLAYEKKVVVVDQGSSTDLTIEMMVKQRTLNEVVIQGKKTPASKIKIWTDIFSSNLIGTYKGIASQCKIINPEVLYFDYNGRTKDLQVFAKRPIIIENAALGYLLRLDLEEFVYNFITDDVVYKYTVFFEDMPVSRTKLDQIANKRKLLYTGSTMHFLRSLYSNTAEKEGFSIFKYNSIQNVERVRVSKIVLQQIEYTYANHSNPRVELERLFTSRDTVNYYNKILLQNKVISFDTVKLKSSVLTKPNKDWTLVNFNSNDTLMVRYRGEDPSKVKAATFSKEISTKSPQVKIPEKPLKHVLVWDSYLFFFNEEGINIQSNGYYAELGAFFYGDMGDRRVAGMLPFDYDVDKKL